MAGFDHKTIDTKWQEYWEREQTFATPTDRTKPKYYVLDMFPYPSGDGLHVGHPKGYTATDVVARAKRMMGFNVLRVMGWDSFGLPAERRAERTGEHPSVITKRNIATFKGQLRKLGLSYDWSRELATSDPKYYKWTQWIFEVLFERGLAYRAEVPVNFCPALGTVLANEEVHDGKYIETGDSVEKRLMKQWMLRITEYADRLSEDLAGLDWPAGTHKAQFDWIGKSIGANVVFALVGRDDAITVFTTRPDTLFGGTYVVLAPEHPLVDQVTTPAQKDAVAKYREEVGKRSERDRTTEAADAPKTGEPTGAFAVNPVNGKHIPIWIATKPSADTRVGWVRISGWLPSMQMSGRPGEVFFHTAGVKLASWDDLPEVMKRRSPPTTRRIGSRRRATTCVRTRPAGPTSRRWSSRRAAPATDDEWSGRSDVRQCRTGGDER